MNHLVYLGVGSNIDAEHHMRTGLDELDRHFQLVRISSVYRSAAFGFDGEPFLNLVAEVLTAESLHGLGRMIRDIERCYGRVDHCPKYSPRTLDIDILTYDDLLGEHNGIVLPRPEITERDYVLCPFAEIAPDLVIPGQSENLDALWLETGQGSSLEQVTLLWQRRISAINP